jgi:hypothetical protein
MEGPMPSSMLSNKDKLIGQSSFASADPQSTIFNAGVVAFRCHGTSSIQAIHDMQI